MTMSMKIHDINDLKTVSHATGGHFFDTGAMRFFDSRVGGFILRNDDTSGYFVTSERYDYKSPRLYTVRRYSLVTREDGSPWVDIETVGDFQDWETLKLAQTAAESHWKNHAYIN
jgi:hypothetical protein